MKTNTTYNQDEMELIRQYETDRIETAAAAFEAAAAELQQAKPAADRWDNDDFNRKVALARRAFGEWVILMITLIASYLLNCVLIQELTPDFAPMVARLAPVLADYSNGIATIIMTTLLFSLLLMIKDKCNITQELDSIRPGLHIAVTAPIRRRIWMKTGIKILYLLVLAYGYGKLYDYIAGGVQLEQQAADVANELTKSTAVSIGGSAPNLGSLDAEIASSQAASFAVFYSIEWCLHATILFLGTSHWFSHGFDIALGSKRRDKKRHSELSRRHASAQARLKTLCQPRIDDDRMNDLRAATIAAMIASSIQPTELSSRRSATGDPISNLGTSTPSQFRANGSELGTHLATT